MSFSQYLLDLYFANMMWVSVLQPSIFGSCFLEVVGCHKMKLATKGVQHQKPPPKLWLLADCCVHLNLLGRRWLACNCCFEGKVSISNFCHTFLRFTIIIQSIGDHDTLLATKRNHEEVFQNSGNLNFSLTTNCCQRLTDWSLGPYDWSINTWFPSNCNQSPPDTCPPVRGYRFFHHGQWFPDGCGPSLGLCVSLGPTLSPWLSPNQNRRQASAMLLHLLATWPLSADESKEMLINVHVILRSIGLLRSQLHLLSSQP